VWRAATRLGKQFCSLSPFFESLRLQIYANSVATRFVFRGARYIGTGRGFATARIPFGVLYSRFAGPSIYLVLVADDAALCNPHRLAAGSGLLLGHTSCYVHVAIHLQSSPICLNDFFIDIVTSSDAVQR